MTPGIFRGFFMDYQQIATWIIGAAVPLTVGWVGALRAELTRLRDRIGETERSVLSHRIEIQREMATKGDINRVLDALSAVQARLDRIGRGS